MGALTRAFNWPETSLGPANEWPQSLRTTLGIVLHSAFPMFLFWGDELLCFYNDAYRPSLGTNGKHPGILGKPAKEAWPEIWDFIGPLIQQVMTTGEPVWFEDQLVPIYRNGRLEDVYWTFSYSPAYNDTGQVGGVLVTCTETTAKVANLKKLEENNGQLTLAITTAEANEQALRASEQRFQAAIAAVQGILWTNNAKGEMAGEQPGWAALTGQTYEEYQGYGWAKAVHPDDAQPTIEAWQKAVSRRSTFVFEHRVRVKTGHWEQFSIRAIPLMNADGSIREWVGVHTNITKERQAEEALRQSEAKFRSLIEEAPVATLLFVGRKLVIEVANETMIRYLGKGPSILGKPVAEALPELEGQPFLPLLDEIFTFGVPYEAKAIRADLVVDGQLTTGYFDTSYKPLRDVAGNVYGIMQMAVDVTAQVLAQQHVKQSQQQLLALFEQSPVGIAIISEDNLTFQMANPFYGQLVGRTPEELIGKPLFEAMPELRGQGFDELLRQVIETGIPYVASEVAVDIVRQNQLETIYVDFVYQPQHEANTNHISDVFVVVTDVTQQVRSRQRVETSEAKLQSIISTAPVAIGLFMGRDLVVELPNQTFIDIVGKGPDIVGKPLREVMPELLTENQPFLQILDDVYTSGKMFQSFGAQVKIVQQGVMTYNYYNITYIPLFNKAGEVYAILDIAVDVTGQILAQQELARQKAYLQNALDIADLGTYQVDVDTNIGHYTDNIRHWLGLPSGTESLDVIFSKIHPDDRAFVEQTIANTLITEGQSRHDITYRLADDTGKTIRYLRSMGKALYENGTSYAINGIL
jgi:PAS domain S-box-containing protein